MPSIESTAIFRRNWSLYDLIAEHNYMHHREIYGTIAELLARCQPPNEYRVLDLGCGNARFLSACLTKTPPARYDGVDMSEAALTEARDYLAVLAGPVALHHGDLLEFAESTTERWDLVFTGYALHHLSADEKRRFFRAVARCLTENGWLLMVDVVREENQSRAEYLEGYLRLMREQWTEIPRAELESACEHVGTYDYPETVLSLDRMAGDAGLRGRLILNRHGAHLAALYARAPLSDGGC
jgi:SAM-dependent methyltransferase